MPGALHGVRVLVLSWGIAGPLGTLLLASKDEAGAGATVRAGAETMALPVTVVPGADHFFHRRLHIIRDIIERAWRH